MYRAISLDVYGTLVHEDDSALAPVCRHVAELAGIEPATVADHWWRRAQQATAVAHGRDFRGQGEINREALATTLRQLGVQDDAARLCEAQVAHWRRPPVFPDSAPFLAQIGLPVCLVSNIDRDDLEAALAHHRLTVSAVVTSEDARAYKPRPEPFELALETLGLPAADVLHVGDSLTADVAGASAVGLDTAWVNRSGAPLPRGFAPTHTVTSLTGLVELLRR